MRTQQRAEEALGRAPAKLARGRARGGEEEGDREDDDDAPARQPTAAHRFCSANLYMILARVLWARAATPGSRPPKESAATT